MGRLGLGTVFFAIALAGFGWRAADAWDRGEVKNFATIPTFTPNGQSAACPGGAASCTSDIEGIAVGPDGTVYTASFGFNAAGALSGSGQFFAFDRRGRLTANFAVPGSTPHLIGMIYQSPNSVLVADLGNGILWRVNPAGASSSMFTKVPTITTAPGLNALAIDKRGNVYVSDSFQGAIWMTGPNGGKPVAWYAPFNSGQSELLLPTPNDNEPLIPPFGANGIAFNKEGTALYALNTAYHSIIKIAVNPDGSAGAASVLTTGINAPDGIAIDGADNLWVVANQGDEIVVVDPAGTVIAKYGDFNGIDRDGSIDGLLFPASPAFSPDGSTLYVTNLALYLPFAGVPEIAVDSAWTLKVRHYNIAAIQVRPRDLGAEQ
ncbi:MAG: SMP-30/gluconolactonase/LRE family protein [Alphaproteobacteria bacterium]|nr:SMP-30/gluconolactonase/LRE family protein [Alphaproteobacteria bacterium]